MSATGNAAPLRPVPAVIGIVLRGRDVLLVRRANPPDAGCWGFPGGKIEPGEPLADAVVREIAEETTVDVEALDAFTALDAFDYDAHGAVRQHFVMVAVLCRWLRGTPAAGDDALDARWFDIDELDRDDLPMSAGVRRAIERAAVPGNARPPSA
ncbi:NUDIX hydrolase [Burkholderia cenocepacia]|uniref:NUDIX hydrolase n=1 Tax=Burkholderia cenocepacia TaxID=95486 RepID=UPI001CF5DD31|nr:NUDIX hydrolase [Burkholderia cenocepacia]MCA8408041.1 NUDIX hydrolase [Burkholderia cenocepacia]